MGTKTLTSLRLSLLLGCLFALGGSSSSFPRVSFTAESPALATASAWPTPSAATDLFPSPAVETAIREIKVRLLGDEELQRRPDWRRVAADFLASVSREFEWQFGIRLVIKEYGAWTSDDSLPTLDLLLDSLLAQCGSSGCDVTLALTGEAGLAPSPYGFSLFQEGVILAVDTGDRAEMTRLLMHEWGHMFGAVHIADTGSLMSHFVSGSAFDALNAGLIEINKERTFNGVEFPIPAAGRTRAAALYTQIAEINKRPFQAPAAARPKKPGRGVSVEQEIQDLLPDGRRRTAFLLDDAHVLLAQIHLEDKEYDEALAECRAALELNPENTETRNLEGIILRRQGHLAEAIGVYRGILKEKPRSPRFLYNLGIALDKSGDLAKAEAAYRRVLELRPNFAEAWNNVGEIDLRAGRLADAEGAFGRALASNDRFALAHANLAEVHIRNKAFDKAMAEVSRALDLNALLAGPHNVRGNLLHRLGRRQEAIAEYTRALELDPRYEKAYYNRGICRFDENDVAGAEADFVKAVEINPAFAEAHASLGYCFLKGRKVDEGVAELELAEKLGAASAGFHVNLSYAYLLKNRVDAAMDEARQALAADPSLAMAHNNLGIAFTRRGMLAEAADSFRKASALDPNYEEAFVNLGALLASRGKPDEAIDAFLKAAAVDAKDGTVHAKLAELYLKRGDSEKALEHAQKAQSLGARVDPAVAEALKKIRE